jgi:hypothetical protein
MSRGADDLGADGSIALSARAHFVAASVAVHRFVRYIAPISNASSELQACSSGSSIEVK